MQRPSHIQEQPVPTYSPTSSYGSAMDRVPSSERKTQEREVGELEELVTKLHGKVAKLETTVTRLEGKAEENKREKQQLVGKIHQLEEEMEELRGDLGRERSKVRQLSEENTKLVWNEDQQRVLQERQSGEIEWLRRVVGSKNGSRGSGEGMDNNQESGGRRVVQCFSDLNQVLTGMAEAIAKITQIQEQRTDMAKEQQRVLQGHQTGEIEWLRGMLERRNGSGGSGKETDNNEERGGGRVPKCFKDLNKVPPDMTEAMATITQIQGEAKEMAKEQEAAFTSYGNKVSKVLETMEGLAASQGEKGKKRTPQWVRYIGDKACEFFLSLCANLGAARVSALLDAKAMLAAVPAPGAPAISETPFALPSSRATFYTAIIIAIVAAWWTNNY